MNSTEYTTEYDEGSMTAAEAEQESIDAADYDQWCLESAARNARVSAADLDEFDRAMHGLGRLIDLADGYVAAHGKAAL